jgi:hypothetical protein
VLGIFGFPAVETTKQILRRADAILAFGVHRLFDRRVAADHSLLSSSSDAASRI